MKSISRLLGYILLSLLLASCGLVKLNGFSNDIDKLSIEQREQIVYKTVLSDKEMIAHKDENTIFMVTGETLLQALPRDKATLVYLFAPYCQGSACIPTSTFRKLATDKGFRPVVVLEYITPEIVGTTQGLYGMNDRAYGSRFVGFYRKKFYNDLTGLSSNSKEFPFSRYILIPQGNSTAKGKPYNFPKSAM